MIHSLTPGRPFPTVPRPWDLQVYRREPGVEGVRLYFFDVPEHVEETTDDQRIYYRAGGVVEMIGHRLIWIEPERH